MAKRMLWRIVFVLAILIALGMCVGCKTRAPWADFAGPTSRPSTLPAHISFASGIVKIRNPDGHGSGFIIGATPTTLFLGTAAHVVKHPGLNIGGIPVSVVRTDSELDLAVVSIPRPAGPVHVFKVAPAKLLEQVVAIGYAGGFDDVLRMAGQVASVNERGGFIVVNTGVHPGMSGGPILDSAGDVVGVVSHGPMINSFIPNYTVLVAGPAQALLPLIPR